MAANQSSKSGRYLELLNLSPDTAWKTISNLASELTGDQHTVRSAIIDLHLTVEIELRRIFFHHFRKLILFSDEAELAQMEARLHRSVDSLNFGQMWRMLEFSIRDSPWPDLELIPEINKTRNQVAHGDQITDIKYRGRNPFTDVDCFANMYFDVWAIKQSIPKFFWRTIEEPTWKREYFFAAYQEYKKRFGDIDFRIDGKRPILS